jgi:hypothetical protein
MPGLRFGVVLGTRRLAALIGSDAARDLLASSKVFLADAAKRIGFVREVLDRSLWPERVAALAAEASPPAASQQTLLRVTIPDTRDADLAELARAGRYPVSSRASPPISPRRRDVERRSHGRSETFSPRCGRYGSTPDKRSIPARICPSLSPAYPNTRPARCGGLI